MRVLLILLTILKIIGIVLLCILGLILLLCLIPVGVTAEYSQEGLAVTAKAGPFSVYRILPRPPKQEETEKSDGKKDKKKDKKKGKKKVEGKETDNQGDSKGGGKKRSIGGMIPMFRELLGVAWELQKTLRRKLKLSELTLYLTMGGAGSDPAGSARTYGLAWAALGNLWTFLERIFVIRNQDVQVNIDFLSKENRIYARATARIFIGAVLGMAIRYGLQALRIYLRHRPKKSKKQKTSEKGETEDGTSSQ